MLSVTHAARVRQDSLAGRTFCGRQTTWFLLHVEDDQERSLAATRLDVKEEIVE